MTTTDSDNLAFSKRLIDHLGSNNLPKELIDDFKNRVNFEARSEDETLLAHYNEDSLWAIKTVRFLKDFHKYQAAPDLTTKNESFLRTAEIFRLQEIKNYYFILQLNNPLLQGVDPYAEDLTSEQETMISEECRTNFWYFLREICRLNPTRAFMANRGNISFMWSYLNHVTTYMIMPRQQGKLQSNKSKVRVKSDKNNLTPEDKWKQIGKLAIGDYIIDREGKEALVMGVHPQGKKRLYRVVCSDGRRTEAGPEHLWTAKNSLDSINGRSLWGDYSTADMILLRKQGAHLQLPLVTPEDGPKQNHLIDPYVMGLMAIARNQGDNLLLDNLNAAQIKHLKDNTPKGMVIVEDEQGTKIKRADGLAITFDKTYGVPGTYLEGSLEDRQRLLQAFADYKGTVQEHNVYIPVQGALRTQLQYLVRSLGGTAKLYKNGIVVTLPEEVQHFHYSNKVRPFHETNALFIKEIKYTGEDECTCIEIDAQEHLYVTDDFMVTHNTVAVQVVNFWLTYIMGRGYTSHLITLKSDNRAQFINAIKTIRNSIPQYLVNSTYKDKDAGTSLTYKAFGEDKINTLYVNVPQQGRDAAGDLGRGLRVGTTNYDESSYIGFIDAIIDGCAPSALTEMANCRDAGLPYGINHITTPNTTLHPSGDYMFKKLMNATEWRESFFDSFSESHLKYRLIKASPKETTSPTVSMIYNYMQLGKDKNWVKRVIDELGLSLAKAKIDLLLMWVEDGENRLFDDITREAINKMKKAVVWSKEYKDSNLYMDFFVTQAELAEMSKKEHNDFFLIGCDTSSAINKDACTIVIRSIRTGKVIGVGRYALTFLDNVTNILVDLLDVIKNSLLIIERNYAHHMIDSLLITLPAKGMDPFTRIYNQIFQDTISYEKEYEEIRRSSFSSRDKNFYLRFKQYFGFNTNANSRKELYGLVIEAVGNTGFGLNYPKLCDELINLRIKSDRIDHDSKAHDDLVISWLLSYWFIKLGMNKSLYGVPPGIALTETQNLLNVSNGVKENTAEPHVIQFLAKVREKVTKLTDELMSTNDNLLALRLEVEIRKLAKILPPDQAKLITVDSVIDEAKIERNKRQLQRRRA